MRKLLLLLLLALSLQIVPAISQNQAFKNAIHAKLNFIDYGLLSDNDLKVGQGFEFAYFRNIAPALNIGVPLKLGSVKIPNAKDANTVIASADLQFRLENIKSSSKVVPFAFAGAGYVLEKNNNHLQFPFGAGLHFRVSPYAFVNLQAEFRKALTDNRDNLQIGLGYVYMLHKSENKPAPPQPGLYDLDKDGTPDSLDVCPTFAGPPTALGCPDADNDGIADTDDTCPDEAGSLETGGCPDYDSDGYADKSDDCPTVAGKFKGCPDTDLDGVLDKDDKCPEEKGPSENMGCPEAADSDGDGTSDEYDHCPELAGAINGCPDSDGDGVADNVDLCPDKAGANNGCPDSDGDGIADNFDKCPEVSGPVNNNGCPEKAKDPDEDGDGVPDKNDPCPDKAGTFGGCPDSDDDSVADNLDKCPDIPGTAKNNGCPELKDADGDGIPDSQDKCPTVAGTAKNKGCPDDSDQDGVPDAQDPCPDKPGKFGGCPDSDGDGIADNVDKCPGVAGLAGKEGCPEEKPVVVKEEKPASAKATAGKEEKKEVTEAREKLATAARAIQFETAKAILKDQSYDVLDEVVTLMRKDPSYSLSISGYTDDVGDDEANFKLSQDRAKACYDYLIFRGIKAERIRYAGFGEARPIASNDTNDGREQNRRVEFELLIE
ncbi:MAG: thrombospondin type 3 repeat-containing protein [Saprospiraceae bacterium]